MEAVVLVIHLLLALSIIGLVLLQRSEGGGLGMGSGSMGGLTTARGAANILTRATGIAAGLFFVTSLSLAVIAGMHTTTDDILEQLDAEKTPQELIVEEMSRNLPNSEPSSDASSLPVSVPVDGAGGASPAEAVGDQKPSVPVSIPVPKQEQGQE